METTKRKRGRPPGKEYAATRTLLLTEEDNEALNELAQRWGCSAAAVVRRLIREKAAELGMAASGGYREAVNGADGGLPTGTGSTGATHDSQ
jgi:hypothetical protein